MMNKLAQDIAAAVQVKLAAVLNPIQGVPTLTNNIGNAAYNYGLLGAGAGGLIGALRKPQQSLGQRILSSLGLAKKPSRLNNALKGALTGGAIGAGAGGFGQFVNNVGAIRADRAAQKPFDDYIKTVAEKTKQTQRAYKLKELAEDAWMSDMGRTFRLDDEKNLLNKYVNGRKEFLPASFLPYADMPEGIKGDYSGRLQRAIADYANNVGVKLEPDNWGVPNDYKRDNLEKFLQEAGDAEAIRNFNEFINTK